MGEDFSKMRMRPVFSFFEEHALDAYQEIGWFNIAVNNAMIVRALQARRRL